MKTKLKKPPVFKNHQEEADFWDTHDITEFASSLSPVNDVEFKIKSSGITVRFKKDDLSNLRKLADQKGMGVTTLIRMAALDYLHDDLSITRA